MDPPEVADRLLNTDSDSVPNCQDDREIQEISQSATLSGPGPGVIPTRPPLVGNEWEMI
ncbi:hypothetical protein GCM10017667_80650 [Streptomyces filamentosus]|uniref:Uncharacterized protein n=1 Tax=Streptomyces filamentosus TaxID=67294 RepID=A0A919C034_STRFL|nr:hypothetical protein GCM10017667_80650 [Streptomyces filamentosus]